MMILTMMTILFTALLSLLLLLGDGSCCSCTCNLFRALSEYLLAWQREIKPQFCRSGIRRWSLCLTVDLPNSKWIFPGYIQQHPLVYKRQCIILFTCPPSSLSQYISASPHPKCSRLWAVKFKMQESVLIYISAKQMLYRNPAVTLNKMKVGAKWLKLQLHIRKAASWTHKSTRVRVTLNQKFLSLSQSTRVSTKMVP